MAAYYAVRIDKSQGMTITAERTEGKYGDSSSESASAHNPRNLPILDAPAPAKGILKKVNSNLNLAKSDIMSEAGTASCVSTVGYITNKLAQRLKARGQHDVLDSPKRTESSSDDIWQQEKENWLRQKEELKAWAAAQGQAGHQVGTGRCMLCNSGPDPTPLRVVCSRKKCFGYHMSRLRKEKVCCRVAACRTHFVPGC